MSKGIYYYVELMYFINYDRNDESVEIILQLELHQHIIHEGVPYKYCVYTPKTIYSVDKDAQYECISPEFANRVLKVETSYRSKFLIALKYVISVRTPAVRFTGFASCK